MSGFERLIVAARDLFSREEMTRITGASPSTVSSWIEGRSDPTRSLKMLIAIEIAEELIRRAKDD